MKQDKGFMMKGRKNKVVVLLGHSMGLNKRQSNGIRSLSMSSLVLTRG